MGQLVRGSSGESLSLSKAIDRQGAFRRHVLIAVLALLWQVGGRTTVAEVAADPLLTLRSAAGSHPQHTICQDSVSLGPLWFPPVMQ
jgi:hypothetical protein